MMQGIVVVCYTFAVAVAAAVILVVSEIKIEISAEVAAVSWKTASSILLAQKKLILCRKGFFNMKKKNKKSAHKSTVFIRIQGRSNDKHRKKNYEKKYLNNVNRAKEGKKSLFLYYCAV